MPFDSECRDCPRLAEFLCSVKQSNPSYFCRPVPPFGDPGGRLLIVGLAPGMHGANATGRPFTGDYAGILLYQTLFEFGLATRPESVSATDGLELVDCRITNAVKCLPPDNKPLGSEVNNCNRYLAEELSAMGEGGVILALGTIAHRAVLKACGEKQSRHSFGHGQLHALPGGRWLLDSYHCSRYNTQTRRLTADMFRSVFRQALDLLEGV